MSRIAFLFPGQGAQIVGMGRQLAETLPATRELYDRANAILGYDLAQLCFEGPQEELDSTVISQPALYVTSLAAVESLRHRQPELIENCTATAGLSLGEYTALAFAGVLDFETGLRLVQQRGQAMQNASDAVPSSMVSVLGLSQDQVESLCEQARADGETLQVANLLCPGNIAISGSNEACERVIDLADAAGAMRVVPLAVAGAFHTSLMQCAVEPLRDSLSNASLFAPRIPVISNVDAQVHDDPEEIKQLLLAQIVSPVRWEDCVRQLLSMDIDQFYEIGPGRVLRSLLRRIDRTISCETIMD